MGIFGRHNLLRTRGSELEWKRRGPMSDGYAKGHTRDRTRRDHERWGNQLDDDWIVRLEAPLDLRGMVTQGLVPGLTG